MTTKYSSIGIFCKPNLPDSTLLYTFDTILSTIYSTGITVVYTLKLKPQMFPMDPKKDLYKNIIVGTFDEIKNSVDLAIAIGGDGTLLGLARQFAQYEAHVIGINQ